MCGRIVFGARSVAAFTDNHTIPNHDRADGDFARQGSGGGKLDCSRHEW
jgi:hypothetical protein